MLNYIFSLVFKYTEIKNKNNSTKYNSYKFI